jgi:hypothetical protein
MAGYHSYAIPRGTYGDFSKIKEECLEVEDALNQGNAIMALVELSDLLGAMTGFLAKHHPSITLLDLIEMRDATARVHESGKWVDRR